ncbi:hypothetical protein L2E82_46213 [Cichorium intybus]|uniref:Uncharacterized protein n=1 Tax=Cichorium intybus TaxID=13427 RepID=A0ACB8YSR8_CICIN|nr:hypothetical protein L1887_25922 [Cichorium endivia]KAI3688562.1 hypothetical protein L2E82_46213 [Cichorium intybus]
MFEKVVKSRVLQVDSQEKWNLITSKPEYLDSPIIVNFTANWCMPATAMEPLFEEQALIHKDAIFLSVDVDEVKGLMEKMKIKAMPTFIMMTPNKNQEREVMDKVVGANPNEIKKRIAAFINLVRTDPK